VSLMWLVIHNAIKCATDCLKFDIECIIVKIWTFFCNHMVREKALEQFCEAAGTKYLPVLPIRTYWATGIPDGSH